MQEGQHNWALKILCRFRREAHLARYFPRRRGFRSISGVKNSSGFA